MQLLPEWKIVLRRAWCVRLTLLAAVLSGAEVVLPYFTTYFERGTFAAMSGVVTLFAVLTRLLAQPGSGIR